MIEFPPPHVRMNWTGDAAFEERVRSSIDARALSHGWLLTGPPGVGKATFAYRIARAVLASDALHADQTLNVDMDAKAPSLIASRAHPDLFVAERRWDDKKGRLETEISVENVRKLTAFLNKTASMGGWRVAIIDSADELNRNAANALLKALEEPPRNALILLVCNAPGRLIATIRSRCRRLELRPLDDDTVQRFIETEGAADGIDAAAIAKAARGRPGYALQLAAGEGGEAVAAMEDFFKASLNNGDIGAVTQSLTGKAGDVRWGIFKSLVLEEITDAARTNAAGERGFGPIANMPAPALLNVWQDLNGFVAHGEGVNLDRTQMILAMQRRLKAAAANIAA